MKFIIFVLAFMSFPVFAQDSDFDFKYAMNIYDAVKAGSWAVALASLIQISKTRVFFNALHKLNPKLWPLVTVILGAASGLVENISIDRPWYFGLIKGSVIGLTASGLYDFIKKPGKAMMNGEAMLSKNNPPVAK